MQSAFIRRSCKCKTKLLDIALRIEAILSELEQQESDLSFIRLLREQSRPLLQSIPAIEAAEETHDPKKIIEEWKNTLSVAVKLSPFFGDKSPISRTAKNLGKQKMEALVQTIAQEFKLTASESTKTAGRNAPGV